MLTLNCTHPYVNERNVSSSSFIFKNNLHTNSTSAYHLHLSTFSEHLPKITDSNTLQSLKEGTNQPLKAITALNLSIKSRIPTRHLQLF